MASKNTIKGRYCSPSHALTGSSGAESCYSKAQLISIASAYNKKFNSKPISLTLNKYGLWSEIEKRMTECTNEWCWMDKLNLESTFVKDSPFRPLRPKGKTQWLSTYDIRDVLKQYESKYPEFIALGPVPIDFCKITYNEVCKLNLKSVLSKGKKTIGIVFNTDPSDQPGKHWISMFIDMRGSEENWEINYFDSYGRAPIAKEIYDFVSYLKNQNFKFKIKMNCSDKACTSKINHQQLNTECGMYSINFIVERLTGKSWEEMVTHNIYSDSLIQSKRALFFRPYKGDTH